MLSFRLIFCSASLTTTVARGADQMFRTSSRRQPPQAGLFDLLAVLFTLSFLTRPALVAAQFLVNGQIFTNALAIVDAPAPNSTFHAGANMPMAIDVCFPISFLPVALHPTCDHRFLVMANYRRLLRLPTLDWTHPSTRSSFTSCRRLRI